MTPGTFLGIYGGNYFVGDDVGDYCRVNFFENGEYKAAIYSKIGKVSNTGTNCASIPEPCTA